MKNFDAHFHLLPEEVYKNASFYNESWGDFSGHLKSMDEAGIDCALISYPTTDYHIKTGISEIDAARVINSATAGIADKSGGRLRHLAVIPLSEPEEMLFEFSVAKREGASGLSMPTNTGGVYPDGDNFLPFFSKVEESGLPVFFHPTTVSPFGHKDLRHPLITPVFQYSFDTAICMAKVVECGLLNRFPRLKVVFASFGGVMPFLAGRFDRTYKMLLARGIVKDMGEDPGAQLKKIYIDTSGTTSPSLLNLALEVFGEDRLLWGSDYPANRDVKGSVEAIRSLGISDKAKEKILSANSRIIING